MSGILWNEMTADRITNLYLYGTDETPVDYFDRIRPSSAPQVSREMNMASFMADGPGRYAYLSYVPAVMDFFAGSLAGGALTGQWTVAQLKASFGLPDSVFRFSLTQSNLDVNGVDYAQRTYIWNSTRFVLDENAVFDFDTGQILNSIIRPFDENFDFVGGNWLANLGNPNLNLRVDPYGLADVNSATSVVELDFVGRDEVPARLAYDINDYTADVAQVDLDYTLIPIFQLYFSMSGLLAGLESNGTIEYLRDDGRPVVYQEKDGGVFDASSILIPELVAAANIHGAVWVGSHIDDVIELSVKNNDIYGVAGYDVLDYSNDEASGQIEVRFEFDGQDSYAITITNGLHTDTAKQIDKLIGTDGADYFKVDEIVPNGLTLDGYGSVGTYEDIADFSSASGGIISASFREDSNVALTNMGQIFGGQGSDAIEQTAGPTAIMTGSGDDFIVTGQYDDFVWAGSGVNIIDTGDGADTIFIGSDLGELTKAFSVNLIVDRGADRTDDRIVLPTAFMSNGSEFENIFPNAYNEYVNSTGNPPPVLTRAPGLASPEFSGIALLGGFATSGSTWQYTNAVNELVAANSSSNTSHYFTEYTSTILHGSAMPEVTRAYINMSAMYMWGGDPTFYHTFLSSMISSSILSAGESTDLYFDCTALDTNDLIIMSNVSGAESTFDDITIIENFSEGDFGIYLHDFEDIYNPNGFSPWISDPNYLAHLSQINNGGEYISLPPGVFDLIA